MDRIGALNWAAYEGIINDAHDTFNKQIVIWKRSLGGLDRNGEDNKTERFQNIPLYCLIDYNAFRKWPTDQSSETGDLDRQTELMFLNRKYLLDNGWINSDGNFDYDPAADRFIHKGKTYKASGDTDVSQDQTKPLLFQIILRREETPTGTKQN